MRVVCFRRYRGARVKASVLGKQGCTRTCRSGSLLASIGWKFLTHQCSLSNSQDFAAYSQTHFLLRCEHLDSDLLCSQPRFPFAAHPRISALTLSKMLTASANVTWHGSSRGRGPMTLTGTVSTVSHGSRLCCQWLLEAA